MPGVNSKGEPTGDYGYDIGGDTKKSPDYNEEKDRFYDRPSQKEPTTVMGKTGYEPGPFDKNGNRKSGPASDVNFLEKDGSWAPAEGRGGTNTGNIAKRGVYSKTLTK